MDIMLNKISTCLLTFTLVLFSSVTSAVENEDILVNLEEPATAEVYASISNLRGWALAPTGIDKIELYIDGRYIYNMPYGGRRQDIANSYPSYPDAVESGFSMAYNYKNLTPGQHTITIRAYDTGGDYNEDTSTFTATRFNSAFISDSSSIDISSASITALNGQSMKLSNIQAEGSTWDITLGWNRSTQGFEIQQITAVSGSNTGSCANISGSWEGYMDFQETTTVAGVADTENYSEYMYYTVTQSGCNIVFTDDTGYYQDLPGTVTGNTVTLQGQALSDEDFELYMEEALALEGYNNATVTVTSNQLTMTGIVSGTSMTMQSTASVQGQISYQFQTLSFSSTSNGSGTLSKQN